MRTDGICARGMLLLGAAVSTVGCTLASDEEDLGNQTAEVRPPPPSRVVIVLFDQMRPEYADTFDMPNFRRLRDAGTDFDRAYLGYMASETVIAHNVITSGQLPKHMGWV